MAAVSRTDKSIQRYLAALVQTRLEWEFQQEVITSGVFPDRGVAELEQQMWPRERTMHKLWVQEMGDPRTRDNLAMRYPSLLDMRNGTPDTRLSLGWRLVYATLVVQFLRDQLRRSDAVTLGPLQNIQSILQTGLISLVAFIGFARGSPPLLWKYVLSLRVSETPDPGDPSATAIEADISVLGDLERSLQTIWSSKVSSLAASTGPTGNSAAYTNLWTLAALDKGVLSGEREDHYLVHPLSLGLVRTNQEEFTEAAAVLESALTKGINTEADILEDILDRDEALSKAREEAKKKRAAAAPILVEGDRSYANKDRQWTLFWRASAVLSNYVVMARQRGKTLAGALFQPSTPGLGFDNEVAREVYIPAGNPNAGRERTSERLRLSKSIDVYSKERKQTGEALMALMKRQILWSSKGGHAKHMHDLLYAVAAVEGKVGETQSLCWQLMTDPGTGAKLAVAFSYLDWRDADLPLLLSQQSFTPGFTQTEKDILTEFTQQRFLMALVLNGNDSTYKRWRPHASSSVNAREWTDEVKSLTDEWLQGQIDDVLESIDDPMPAAASEAERTANRSLEGWTTRVERIVRELWQREIVEKQLREWLRGPAIQRMETQMDSYDSIANREVNWIDVRFDMPVAHDPVSSGRTAVEVQGILYPDSTVTTFPLHTHRALDASQSINSWLPGLSADGVEANGLFRHVFKSSSEQDVQSLSALLRLFRYSAALTYQVAHLLETTNIQVLGAQGSDENFGVWSRALLERLVKRTDRRLGVLSPREVEVSLMRTHIQVLELQEAQRLKSIVDEYPPDLVTAHEDLATRLRESVHTWRVGKRESAALSSVVAGCVDGLNVILESVREQQKETGIQSAPLKPKEHGDTLLALRHVSSDQIQVCSDLINLELLQLDYQVKGSTEQDRAANAYESQTQQRISVHTLKRVNLAIQAAEIQVTNKLSYLETQARNNERALNRELAERQSTHSSLQATERTRFIQKEAIIEEEEEEEESEEEKAENSDTEEEGATSLRSGSTQEEFADIKASIQSLQTLYLVWEMRILSQETGTVVGKAGGLAGGLPTKEAVERAQQRLATKQALERYLGFDMSMISALQNKPRTSEEETELALLMSELDSLRTRLARWYRRKIIDAEKASVTAYLLLTALTSVKEVSPPTDPNALVEYAGGYMRIWLRDARAVYWGDKTPNRDREKRLKTYAFTTHEVLSPLNPYIGQYLSPNSDTHENAKRLYDVPGIDVGGIYSIRDALIGLRLLRHIMMDQHEGKNDVVTERALVDIVQRSTLHVTSGTDLLPTDRLAKELTMLHAFERAVSASAIQGLTGAVLGVALAPEQVLESARNRVEQLATEQQNLPKQAYLQYLDWRDLLHTDAWWHKHRLELYKLRRQWLLLEDHNARTRNKQAQENLVDVLKERELQFMNMVYNDVEVRELDVLALTTLHLDPHLTTPGEGEKWPSLLMPSDDQVKKWNVTFALDREVWRAAGGASVIQDLRMTVPIDRAVKLARVISTVRGVLGAEYLSKRAAELDYSGADEAIQRVLTLFIELSNSVPTLLAQRGDARLSLPVPTDIPMGVTTWEDAPDNLVEDVIAEIQAEDFKIIDDEEESEEASSDSDTEEDDPLTRLVVPALTSPDIQSPRKRTQPVTPTSSPEGAQDIRKRRAPDV